MRAAPALLAVVALSAPSRAVVAGLVLEGDRAELELPGGFSRVDVSSGDGEACSLIVTGPRDALAHLQVHGARATDAIDEDGVLPRAISFVAGVEAIWVGLEVHVPVRLQKVCAAPTTAIPTDDDRVLMIGMPTPGRRDDGYVLERPNRYQFARPDVVFSLRRALAATRARFRRDPLGLSDLTQWDGRRPGLDVGKLRHISHDGGRDVDVALPSLEEPSTMRDHCEKDYNDDKTSAACKPGTGKGVDAMRLAFLGGTLVADGVLDKMFLDREFFPEVARAAERLARWGWIPKKAAARLEPGAGILVHVPWHTDHVHLRFLGAKALAPFPS